MMDILRNTLDKLTEREFERFKHCLRDKKNKIAWRELEKADINDTVDLMVKKYTSDAGEIMAAILETQMNNLLYATDLKTNLMKLKKQSKSSADHNMVKMDITPQSRTFREGSSMSHNESGSDLTVVLLGSTGSGKSATANTILGRKAFEAKMSFDPVTQDCKRKKRKFEGRTITVIDTPGISCYCNQLRTEIQKFLSLGPHVFLLVIRLDERLTEEVKSAVKWVEENLGKDVMCYIIILFTYADQLQGTELPDYCRGSRFIRTLINNCGGRFHSFSNNDRHDNDQVKELIAKIDKLVWWNSDQAIYDSSWYDEAQRELKKRENE